MRTEPFQNAYGRYGVFITGILCLWHAVRRFRRGIFYLWAGFAIDIRRIERPVAYWFANSFEHIVLAYGRTSTRKERALSLALVQV